MNDEPRSNASPEESSAVEVLSRITDAVFALDDEWRFIYLNEQAERVLQRDEAELLGEAFWDAFPETVGSTFESEYERAMETGEPVTFEEFYEPLDAWVEVHAYPSETGLSVYLRDVTERVDQRQTLRDRERALRRAYEVITDAEKSFPEQIDSLLTVVRQAIDTDYATLSRVHDDVGEYIFEVVDAPDDADLRGGDAVPLEDTNCDRVVETEQTLVLDDVDADAPELADRAGNAEWGISCYLGAPVFVDDSVYGTFCFYDVEARTEEFSEWEVTFVNLLSNWVSYELERQRRNDRLESFASMVAHELRNPLNVAQLYSQRAAEGDESSAEEVADALDRIEEMVEVLLVIARGSDSVVDSEPVDVADAADEAWGTVSVVEADLSVEADLTVEADPVHFRHLLENLFENAVEHGGPDVTVRVGGLPTGFYVADDGSGIPAEERERVFEAGYTTDAGGIGLGLTFVRQLAHVYDWNCAVDESEDGGVRFEFTGADVADEA